MELAEFVRGALVEIAKGVRGANEELKDLGATYQLLQGSSAQGSPGLVEFDVAVTVAKADAAAASARISVAVLSAGLGGEEKTSEQRVSHIRFRVGIMKYFS